MQQASKETGDDRPTTANQQNIWNQKYYAECRGGAAEQMVALTETKMQATNGDTLENI